MERTCARALELGLPAIAFTDHQDLVLAHREQHPLDVDGYLECVDRCRSKFPGLRILSGVELGEPHWFPDETAALLAGARFERVLGSVHCLGGPADAVDHSKAVPGAADPAELMRRHLAETLRLLQSPQPFEILAHLDYPKRYWPGEFVEAEFEAEYREVLREAARRGAVLEVNTTRGRVLSPGPAPLRWWHEEGGGAVSFGSDAHAPDAVATGFGAARQAVEAAGFKAGRDPLDYFRR